MVNLRDIFVSNEAYAMHKVPMKLGKGNMALEELSSMPSLIGYDIMGDATGTKTCRDDNDVSIECVHWVCQCQLE